MTGHHLLGSFRAERMPRHGQEKSDGVTREGRGPPYRGFHIVVNLRTRAQRGRVGRRPRHTSIAAAVDDAGIAARLAVLRWIAARAEL